MNNNRKRCKVIRFTTCKGTYAQKDMNNKRSEMFSQTRAHDRKESTMLQAPQTQKNESNDW